MRVHSFSGGEALAQKLAELIKKAGEAGSLRVGFLEGSTHPDGTSVPMVAALNEFGTSKMPARPFFRNMIAEKSPNWGPSLGAIAEKNGLDMKRTLALMGEGIGSQLQQAIVDFNSVPLSPATVDAKGFSKQLIDTAVMINSVGYQVDTEEKVMLPKAASRGGK
jgi:hypothetical protein